MGPTTDFSNFMGAVIDDRAFARVTGAIDRAKADPNVTVDRRRHVRRQRGLVHPPDRASSATDPTAEYFTDEYFGPVLAVHVYDDDAATTRCSRRWSRSRRTR